MQYNDFLYDIDIELKREQFFYCAIQSIIMAFDLLLFHWTIYKRLSTVTASQG